MIRGLPPLIVKLHDLPAFDSSCQASGAAEAQRLMPGSFGVPEDVEPLDGTEGTAWSGTSGRIRHGQMSPLAGSA